MTVLAVFPRARAGCVFHVPTDNAFRTRVARALLPIASFAHFKGQRLPENRSSTTDELFLASAIRIGDLLKLRQETDARHFTASCRFRSTASFTMSAASKTATFSTGWTKGRGAIRVVPNSRAAAYGAPVFSPPTEIVTPSSSTDSICAERRSAPVLRWGGSPGTDGGGYAVLILSWIVSTTRAENSKSPRAMCCLILSGAFSPRVALTSSRPSTWREKRMERTSPGVVPVLNLCCRVGFPRKALYTYGYIGG